MRQHLFSRFDDLLPVAMLKRAHRQVTTVLNAHLIMKTDVVEHDEDYTVTAELPGYDKDAITVRYADDCLTIQAAQPTDGPDRDDDGRMLHRERPAEDLTRHFPFKNVLKDQIQAHYNDGLLTVTLPKKVADDAGKITIQ
ncbi:Hsp20/alpha crystallin family protein [Lactiplantibacillus sp. WILCCON 0030]|uniref:Hsp20/alpha crystallin family protein n=1 Tax=Lactiplantibacillus brownii TaxID=3069269 RepID=A0ABU1AAL9_9LACO|nr:Hsp20/alpha crystallin family protein [Lactiplantibacillus brownii]MDQ7938009.1 Hsp20/alpha crystallin family protein [Lactiplantibacillus brownii]